jgi:hypothetical protein
MKSENEQQHEEKKKERKKEKKKTMEKENRINNNSNDTISSHIITAIRPPGVELSDQRIQCIEQLDRKFLNIMLENY